jgi:hypothetical protein
LLQQAVHRKPFLSVPLFDGSAVMGTFQVSAVVGKVKLPPETSEPQPAEGGINGQTAAEGGKDDQTATIDQALLMAPSWPITLAFFDLSDQSETPIFQIHLDYYANGATDSLLQDFGDFALKGNLSSLKALPKPKC